jgi:biopolymer transport protein ExbB/TolQ
MAELNLTDLFKDGGTIVWPILLCGIFGLGIAVERFFFVYFQAAIDSVRFMDNVQRHVLDGQTDAALRLCNSEPSALLPRVLKAALLHANRSEGEMSRAVEEATRATTPLLGRRLSFLPMVANAATLLGLLGTIQGLVVSFHSVGAATADARSSELAEGIAVAMYTTFLGLAVAIPVLVVHSFLAAKANSTLDDIDHYGLKIVNLLLACREGRAATPDAPLANVEG